MALEIDRAALARSDRRSRDAAAAWRKGEAYRAGIAAFAGIAPHDVDAVVTAATVLLGDAEWLRALIAPLAERLSTDPWFEPPLRAHRDPLRTGAVLIETPAAAITASIISADALAHAPPPRTVVVSGRVSVVRYHRAGEATLRRWRAEPVGPGFSAAVAAPAVPLPAATLSDGAVLRHDGRIEGHLLDAPTTDIATVTATIRGGAAPLMREYALADGALVRSAAVDDAESRTQMLLTLLRLSGRADAHAQFDAAIRHPSFALRWAAMREWLALDAVAALPRLRALADDPHAEVRAAARATLPQAEALVACRG